MKPEVNVERHGQEMHPGDVVGIGCDGLTGMVREEDIARIVRAHDDLNDGCRELVAAANERGGVDNITVVLVRTT